MSQLDSTALNADIAANIYTNRSGLIKGNVLRQRLFNIADSALNRTTHADVNNGYLKINSSGHVNIAFVKAASPTGKFLRDDGTWQTVSGGGGGGTWGSITGTIGSQTDLTTYISTQIANLVNSAPGALDTLNELASAMGNDANFSTTVTNALATKAPLASPTFTGTITTPLTGGNKFVIANASGQLVNFGINFYTSGNAYMDFDTYMQVGYQAGLGNVVWSAGTIPLTLRSYYNNIVMSSAGIVMNGYIGLNVNPTAFLDIYGATSSVASLRIRAGSAVSAPNDGEIWHTGGSLYMRFGGTTKEFQFV